MQEVMILIIGSFVGYSLFVLPPSLWLKTDIQFDKEAFKSTFPKKMGVFYLYKFLPLTWFLLYALVIFPGVSKLFDNGNLILYFVGYFLLGGFGILESLVEITSGIAPIRRKSGFRGSLGFSNLVANETVRHVGLRCLLLIIGVGLLSWLAIYLLI